MRRSIATRSRRNKINGGGGGDGGDGRLLNHNTEPKIRRMIIYLILILLNLWYQHGRRKDTSSLGTDEDIATGSIIDEINADNNENEL